MKRYLVLAINEIPGNGLPVISQEKVFDTKEEAEEYLEKLTETFREVYGIDWMEWFDGVMNPVKGVSNGDVVQWMYIREIEVY